MSVSYIVSQVNDEVMNTDYFVEQLKKKWSEVKIHFITDPNAHSLLQFSVEGDFPLLGDFSGDGVSYRAYSEPELAQFALWYRSITPADWQLRYFNSGLYFKPMFITNETTEEQLIAGFAIPFDSDEYE
jgi:hypothetical protein